MKLYQIAEGIRMKLPDADITRGNYGELRSSWTTSNGNKVTLIGRVADDKTGEYEFEFTVNNTVQENPLRKSDREILQTVVGQVYKIIQEKNITIFSFSAYSDISDNVKYSKLIRPFQIKCEHLLKEIEISERVKHTLQSISDYLSMVDTEYYRKSLIEKCQYILNAEKFTPELTNFFKELGATLTHIDQDIGSNENNGNRRLLVYVSLIKQHLGPDWRIDVSGDTITAYKNK